MGAGTPDETVSQYGGMTLPIHSEEMNMIRTITPTQHEKNEWARMAQSAYARGANSIGRRYSAAASLPRNSQMQLEYFDALQNGYREWLVSDSFPV